MNAFKKPKILAIIVSVLSLGVSSAQSSVFAKATQNFLPLVEQKIIEQKLQTAMPVVIYYEHIGDQNDGKKDWPVFKLWRKIDGHEPEVLIDSIGKIGEYPSNFKLSPDNKTLLINFENKLAALDLETKKLKTVFSTTEKQIHDYIFSPDSEKVIMIIGTGEKDYDIVQYSFADKSTATLTHEKVDDGAGSFSFKKWRSDNIILLTYGWPGMLTLDPWTFNLNTNKMKKVPLEQGGGMTLNSSETGKYFVAEKKNIKNPCSKFSEEFAGQSTSVYILIDPLTADKKQSIGKSGKVTEIVGFSPDDNQVLYATYVPKNNRNECYDPPEKSYFMMEIPNGHVTSMDNYRNVLKEWGRLEITIETVANKTISRAWYGETPVVKTDNGEILATYVQTQIVSRY